MESASRKERTRESGRRGWGGPVHLALVAREASSVRPYSFWRGSASLEIGIANRSNFGSSGRALASALPAAGLRSLTPVASFQAAAALGVVSHNEWKR